MMPRALLSLAVLVGSCCAQRLYPPAVPVGTSPIVHHYVQAGTSPVFYPYFSMSSTPSVHPYPPLTTTVHPYPPAFAPPVVYPHHPVVHPLPLPFLPQLPINLGAQTPVFPSLSPSTPPSSAQVSEAPLKPPHHAVAPPGPEEFAPPLPPNFNQNAPPVPIPEGAPLRFGHSTYGLPSF